MSEERWLNYMEFMSFNIYDWILVFACLFLGLEILNDAVTRRFSGERLLETATSVFTQVPYYFSEIIIFGSAVYLYFMIYEWIPWKIPVNGYSAVLVLLLADLTYYIEHYAIHRIRLFWLAHSVHHSSSVYNTATAFRFSLFDPVVSVLFHLPLVLMGFNPIMIFAAEVLVQAYQFWIHNEMIGKLGPLEWFFNTPSHHRVHHGSDSKYIDKNFGGILIIWDRIFGTFQKEEELPTYGLTTPMTSKNPITVQFFEFSRLYKDLTGAKSRSVFIRYLIKPPGWQPKNKC
ncbi:sterol desaturase family protein [Aestuariirhabdus sp. Z084]|uniref:sterol desaturase family protein n=1 Tax=Aestuariirhabdus haliotis TaxID=2918751 RepID=UPI00201B3ECC|nr:sterol desaturase family protein [Aestuariirhabdus haliotis]MCL6414358.1 sterol desaturase family protein [Aestuariirhabdus haliotis]MCL6418290.1 sterol desaturase family protein [Aestuariirhabdus haliotis]